MAEISVIVPIFHGDKYIDNIISQIEMAADGCCQSIELLLINDDPDMTIMSKNSDEISIIVMNTDSNRGIHGARVRGLMNASGEYIVFLDQDDRISKSYFQNQVKQINDNDAVVCYLINGNRKVYSQEYNLENMLNLNYFLNSKNPIISPGQVLIKKQSIPDIWIHNLMTNNGADDWFLWLSMLAQECKFSINFSEDYEHVIHDNNCSWQEQRMAASENEMFEIFKRNDFLNTDELECLSVNIRERNYSRLIGLDKQAKMSFLYRHWIELYRRNDTLANILLRRRCNKVAIYGAGEIGHQIYLDLVNSDIEVLYFIDRGANLICEKIPVYLPSADLPNVNLIIISLISGESSAVDTIEEKISTSIPYITISELLRSDVCSD